MKKFTLLPFLLFSFSFLFGIRPTQHRQITFAELCNMRARASLDLARVSLIPGEQLEHLQQGRQSIRNGRCSTHNARIRRQLSTTLYLIKKEERLVLIPRLRNRVTRDLFGATEEDANR
ncbi:hypothetical protein HOM50_01610 [bacterium]|jgi:hypothetical protein|nr:hypothetical protein [bacterium]MBT5015086.1 hypothetical protein [bacterium]